MLGPVVNGIVIIICALVGNFLIRGIPSRIEEMIRKAIGLCVVYLGISGVLETQHVMLLIISMVVGSILGELINIDRRMNNLGLWAEKKMGMGEGTFAKGFITSSLLYCVGSMAIVGALQSGLQGNHNMLYAKSILDGIMAIVFGSTMGIGVAFSGVLVFLYEGSISLGAGLVKDVLTQEMITELSAVGSLLIMALGLNFLEVKEIKVANMLPAMFIPVVFFAVSALCFPEGFPSLMKVLLP